MNLINLLQSEYYPYHLTWEEINDPGIVIQKFLNTWDLPECRLKLRRCQNLILAPKSHSSETEHTELKIFLNELERLIEAVYIIRLQYDEAQNMHVKMPDSSI